MFLISRRRCARTVLRLAGDWQMARWDEQDIKDRAAPIKELPAGYKDFFWKGAKVPGNRDDVRPEMQYCHRFLYRTRVHVPAEQKGRSFVLRFPNTALIASVFVNGKYCGGSTAPRRLGRGHHRRHRRRSGQ